MALAEQVAFVLVRTKTAGNIGAAARALANMGFADLRLVAPRTAEDRVESEMAVHGRHILEHAVHYPNLAAALSDRTLTIGTTCRGGPLRREAQPLRAAATELGSTNHRERIAIIFGPEDHGLDNRELRLCQRLVVIPTSPGLASINLAQAVMLVAWELFMADSARSPAASLDPDPLFARAPVAEVEAMLERTERALIAIGFLPADHPERIMFAFHNLFGRAGLNRREVDILNGLARQIEWFAGGGRATIDLKRALGKKVR